MAVLVTDGFDSYASLSDLTSKWVYSNTNALVVALSASTAFSSGQCFSASGINAGSAQMPVFLTSFPWGSNETTIYGSIRLKWASASAQATDYLALTLQDVSNNQCTIRWNGDGSINLYSGGPTGTLLNAYASQFSLNTWDSWQFKIVINNTTGSIELRKNGSTTNAITLTGVNTRAGSANAYANAVQIGFGQTSNFGNAFGIDDVFLNSAAGAAPTSWPGDLRAVQQTPAAATQAQFTAGGTGLSTIVQTTGGTGAISPGSANVLTFFGKYTLSRLGTVPGITLSMASALTGHIGVALYDAVGTGGGPGNLLGFVTFTNPTVGFNTANFGSPLTLSSGTYYFATLADASYTPGGASSLSGWSGTAALSYASGFPATAAVSVSNSFFNTANMAFTLSTSNLGCVQEAAEDGDVTYIASSTVGQEDIFTLSAVPTTYSVVGVEYFAWWKKSDAGARTAQLSVQANGSADTAEITNAALGNSYSYSGKFLATDPTGAGWTPTTANGAKIGISVTA